MSELGSDRMTEADRLARSRGFDGEAERYDRMRPTYPVALFDAMAAFAGATAGARVLEVGPGTGQATVGLVDRGWRVTAVEPAPELASRLRRRLGDRIAVEVGTFEDRPTPAEPFDLLLCATSFHWLDPAVRLGRIGAALRPGGTVGIVWTRHVRGGTQAFFDAAQPLYDRYADADPAMALPDEADVRPRTGELERSALFGEVASRRFPGEIAYGTDDYLDLMRTYSETIALPEDSRNALLGGLRALLDGDFGGRVTKRYLFDLVLARRI